LEKFSLEEKLKMNIGRLENKEISKILQLKVKKDLNKIVGKIPSIKPIEEELKLLYGMADFDRNEYNQSVLPYQNHGKNSTTNINVKDENYDKLPDPLDILRHRYSTFLFKKPERPDQKLSFGEKYTAYQIPISSSKTDYEKKVELIGDYHEDYERVLIFASNMIGETIDELQNHIMKVEVELLQAIEKEGL